MQHKQKQNMEKAELEAALRLIYDSWIVRYGTPQETMANGMATDMNAYFDSINYNLVLGTCFSLQQVLDQLSVVGITGIDRPADGA